MDLTILLERAHAAWRYLLLLPAFVAALFTFYLWLTRGADRSVKRLSRSFTSEDALEDKHLGEAWQRYSRTMIPNAENSPKSTRDAADFFNLESVILERPGRRWWTVFPKFFFGLGLICLTVGAAYSALSFRVSTHDAVVDSLKHTLTVMAVAGGGFMLAAFMALILSMVNRSVEHRIDRALQRFSLFLNRAFNITAFEERQINFQENLRLVRELNKEAAEQVSRAANRQEQALRALAETVRSRSDTDLEKSFESVQRSLETLGEEISGSLAGKMAPLFNRLEWSLEKLRQEQTEHTHGEKSPAAKLAQGVTHALEELHGAVRGLAEPENDRVKAMTAELAGPVRVFSKELQAMRAEVRKGLEVLGNRLDNSSGAVSGSLKELQEGQSRILQDMTREFQATAAQNKASSEKMRRALADVDEVLGDISRAAALFAATGKDIRNDARLMQGAAQTMTEKQKEYLRAGNAWVEAVKKHVSEILPLTRLPEQLKVVQGEISDAVARTVEDLFQDSGNLSGQMDDYRAQLRDFSQTLRHELGGLRQALEASPAAGDNPKVNQAMAGSLNGLKDMVESLKDYFGQTLAKERKAIIQSAAEVRLALQETAARTDAKQDDLAANQAKAAKLQAEQVEAVRGISEGLSAAADENQRLISSIDRAVTGVHEMVERMKGLTEPGNGNGQGLDRHYRLLEAVRQSTNRIRDLVENSGNKFEVIKGGLSLIYKRISTLSKNLHSEMEMDLSRQLDSFAQVFDSSTHALTGGVEKLSGCAENLNDIVTRLNKADSSDMGDQAANTLPD